MLSDNIRNSPFASSVSLAYRGQFDPVNRLLLPSLRARTPYYLYNNIHDSDWLRAVQLKCNTSVKSVLIIRPNSGL